MPQARASIWIAAPPDEVFAITNDVARWPDLFSEYRGATVLSSEGEGRFAKLVFELSNKEGERWRSWRILDHRERVAIAQRGEPKFPFLYMHLTWTYEPSGGGVQMTWLQDFEIDPAAPVTNEQALGRMTDHMAKNQVHFKEVLEAEIGGRARAASGTSGDRGA
jgi:aromatase